VLIQNLKRILAPRRLFSLAADYFYDFTRYSRYSSILGSLYDEEKLRAVIMLHCHIIEKGLSLRAPRAGFGQPSIRKAISYIRIYVERYGVKQHLTIPVGAMNAYIDFHKRINYDVSWLAAEVASLSELVDFFGNECSGGTVLKTREEILQSIAKGGLDLFLSRSSCRQFEDQSISESTVFRAVEVAQRSPAVCNRQAGRIRIFHDKSQIARILDFHTGARGFSSEIPLLFCITVDVRNFNGSGERYQGWIDGGMFAMSLVFGLHAQGLGTCCLNWSKDRNDDKIMRSMLGIPPYEQIIMFVATGYMPENFRVASSIRKPLSEVIVRGVLN